MSHSDSSPTYFSGRSERIDLVVAESEGAEEAECEVENAADFIFELVRSAEDVSVVLSKAHGRGGGREGHLSFRTGRRCPAPLSLMGSSR